MSELIPVPERAPSPAPYTPPVQPWSAGYDPAADAETIDLREVLAVLRRHVWLILAVTVVAVLAAAFVVSRQKAEYRAQAVIRLDDERKSLTGGIVGLAAEQAMGRKSDPLLSQLQVLQSRSLAGSVVDRLGLRLDFQGAGLAAGELRDVQLASEEAGDTLKLRFDEDGYSVKPRSGEPVKAAYGQPAALERMSLTVTSRPAIEVAEVAVLSRGEAIDRLLKSLKATPRQETNVVDVQFTAHSPVTAQKVVNAAIEEFQSMSARAAQDESFRRRRFLEDQLTQTDSMLADAQLALTHFRERRQLYSSSQMLAAQQAGQVGLDLKREELAADRQMFQALLADLTRSTNEARSLRTLVSAPGIAANPVIAQLYGQLVRYESSMDSLTAGSWGSAESNPDVQRLRVLVTSTRTKLADAVKSHVAALDARLSSLDAMSARNAEAFSTLPAAEAEEARLAQRVETVRKVADQLREEYQKARISEAIEVGQVGIVDLAPVPSQPIGSGKALKLALALMLGLMLGSGAAFLKEHLNTALQQREDVERLLQVPGLAVIPQIHPETSGAKQALLQKLRKNTSRNTLAPSRLVTSTGVSASSAEAYRTLRTNLIFSQAVQTFRRVVVTSAAAGEGKTTTSANLALTFAQQGKRVLLVDCDLRRPQINATFRVPSTPGLTELVLGHSTPAEAIRKTEVDGLWVLPSGTLPPNPSELLGGERMAKALEVLGNQFDLVVLDTPPVLAASDASVLAARADGVLLVVRAGQTHRGAAQMAVQQLRGVGAHVVGAVINDPDHRMHRYGGYYGYYGYYDASYYAPQEQTT